MIKAKKHLAQHFLIHSHIAQKIVATFLKYPKYFTIEIGAGTGILTKLLLHQLSNNTFIAIDIDPESIHYLKNKFPQNQHQFLLEDFLQSENIDTMLSSQNVNIIGNFPYNISSQILFKVLEHRRNVQYLVGMFQKEVAERICASPENKNYGILSVLLQCFYHTRYLFTVHEGSFNPPPKVKSAVIALETKNVKSLPVSENLFFEVVKTSFQQRRKTLKNSLKKWSALHSLPYSEKRPEQLTYTQFLEIVSYIEKNEKNTTE